MARRLVLPFVAVLNAVVCVSCASFHSNVDWTGHTIDEVIAQNGPPKSVQTAGDGTKLYVWEFPHDLPFSRWVPGPDGTPQVETTTVTKYTTRTFLVRADGTITSFAVRDH